MKIFNEENSKKVVYVQREDLALLDGSSLVIPGSCLITGLVDDSNRRQFVRFEDPRVVEFFEGIDWIVDYKKFRFQDDDTFAAAYNDVVGEMNDIAVRYNGMFEFDRKRHPELLERYELLEHKKKEICTIFDTLYGCFETPFPIVPDADGFSVEMGGEETYRARGCFEPGKFVVYKMNGEKFSRKDKLPYGFIQNAIGFSLLKEGNRCAFMGDYSFNVTSSSDGKYLVVSYIVDEYRDDYNASVQHKNNRKDARDIKQFLKTIFPKKA